MEKKEAPTDSMETIILKQIISQIDLSEYIPQIKEAIKQYFSSSTFQNDLEEAFQDEELTGIFANQFSTELSKVTKNIKITFGNK